MLNESMMMMMMMVRRMGYNKSNSVGMMMIVDGAGVVVDVMASWWNESLPCPMT